MPLPRGGPAHLLWGRRLGPGPYDRSKTPFSLPALSCPPAAFSVGNSSGEKDNSRLEPLKPAEKTRKTYGASEISTDSPLLRGPRAEATPPCHGAGPRGPAGGSPLLLTYAVSGGPPRDVSTLPVEVMPTESARQPPRGPALDLLSFQSAPSHQVPEALRGRARHSVIPGAVSSSGPSLTPQREKLL